MKVLLYIQYIIVDHVSFVSSTTVTVQNCLFMGGLINGSLQVTPAVEGITTPRSFYCTIFWVCQKHMSEQKGRDKQGLKVTPGWNSICHKM